VSEAGNGKSAPGEVVELRLRSIYFTTSSKEGYADLTITHLYANESLTLPVVPLNAIPDALPLIEPAFAHYAAQWEKYLVPDPNETDATGFAIPAGGMPRHIAPPTNWEDLAALMWSYTTDEIKNLLAHRRPDAVFVWDRELFDQGNLDEVAGEPEDFGIEMWSD